MNLLLCILVVTLTILAHIRWVKEQVFSLCELLRSLFKTLPENGNLTLVMQVVGEESLLRVEFLFGCNTLKLCRSHSFLGGWKAHNI